MSDVTVRPVREAEFAEVGELVVQSYLASGFVGSAEDGYAVTLGNIAHRVSHAEVLVAEDERGVLLGSVTVVPPGSVYSELGRPGELEFRMLAVRPAVRGRGVGEALVRVVIERARAAGAARVVLCSLAAMSVAHRIYTRLGFARLPERDWSPEPHIPLLAFCLDLTAVQGHRV